MRLRALRKLEEIEIRKEFDTLKKEQKELKRLVKDESLQWKEIGSQIAALKKQFGPQTELGRRRTEIGEAPSAVVVPLDAFVEREPVTVICSAKGWIRTLKGHVTDTSDLKYKEGDRPRFQIHAETTDKLLVFGTNGRFYTLSVDKLPGGRGHGEPVRLMIDLGNEHDVVAMFVHRPDRKLLVASSDGRGFVVPEKDVVAQTRAGKQVLNLAPGAEAQACVPAEGDMVAALGENRKLLLFPLEQVPEMTRGRGVILQKYKNGGLADVKVFTRKEGLSWRNGERTRTETDIRAWIGDRAQAGRLPPTGFTRANRFT
jgi:topoisomerase-4 subunit A